MPSKRRGRPGTARRGTTAAASPGFEPRLDDPGRDEEVGADVGDGLGDAGLDLDAFARRGPRGEAGPKRTSRLPAASLPEAAQRTTWPQNR